MDQPPPFVCTVVSLHDADGPIRCRNGVKIRVAGVNAREADGTCRSNAPCPVMRHEQAKPIAERLVLRKTLTCRKVDQSWKRAVAVCRLPDGSDLRCSLNATGATVDWPEYVARYHLPRCPR